MSDRPSRREFMGLTTAGAAGILTRPWLGDSGGFFPTIAAQSRQGVDPDLVVFNAKVYTMDHGRCRRAEAFAMSGGRFVAVGSTATIKGLAGKRTQTFDAKQMTIVPGFTDCHNHAGGDDAALRGARRQSVRGRVRHHRQHHREAAGEGRQTAAGHVGRGLLPRRHEAQGQAPAQRHDLDQVSTEHPVVVRHRGGHTSFYNTKALEMAKVTKDTPNPPGGTFDRDASGELNGRVTDRARGVFNSVGSGRRSRRSSARSASATGIAHISKQFARYGLTSVHHEGGDLAAIQDVRARGDLHHRVSYEASGRVLDAMISNGITKRLRRRVDQVRRDVGAHGRRVVLRAHDGAEHSLPRASAAVQGQRHGRRRRSSMRGSSVCIAPAFRSTATRTATSRSTCISPPSSARRRLRRAPTRGPRSRTARSINDDLVRRMKALGAVPAMFTTYAYYNTDKFPFYGEDLMKRAHGVPHDARRGHPRGGRLGLQPRPVRAAHGHPGDGDTNRVGRNDVGRESAGQRRRGHPDQHAQRRATRRTRSRSRARSRPASSPTSSCWPTTRTRWRVTRSRTSRSSAPSSEGRRCIRREAGTRRRLHCVREVFQPPSPLREGEDVSQPRLVAPNAAA